jgi:hypothetical protein
VNRRPRPARKLRFDALEAREVPATAVLTHGDLVITGTAGSDAITVRQGASAITVSGVGRTFATAAVATIRISSLGGDDAVTLDAVTKPAVIRGGDGNDSIWGGAAADYIDGEAGDDWLMGEGGADRLAGDTGDDAIFGGAGNDLIAGGAGNDGIQGNNGVDHIWGGTGLDVISGGAGTDHIYDDLSPLGVQISDTSYVHHHILGFADNSGFGWFDASMPDADLRRQARAAARNNFLGRNEMIDLFEQATDGTDVNANEFDSLKNLVNTDQVRFNEQARYFGKKVMNGDPANQWFTGGADHREALGNLTAGATDDHLQRLVDKWFLGKDLPMAKSRDRATTFGYQAAAGGLFVGGARPTDIRQGDLGDCYFLSALSAVARQDPARIAQMFTDNGDGTYTVRLFKDGHAEYVTVDKRLPVNADGKFPFANKGGTAAAAGNELWVALAEKAYAQFNESGWTGQDGTNSYNGIGGAVPEGEKNHDGLNYGSLGTPLTQVTNASVSLGPTGMASFADVRAAFAAGKAITAITPADPPDGDVVGNHVYMMVGYSATNHTITLRNPRGNGGSKPESVTLTFAEFQANFSFWAAANI